MKQTRTSSVEKAMLNPVSLQGVSAARRTGAGSRSVWDSGRIFRVSRLPQCAERVAAAGAGRTQLPRSLPDISARRCQGDGEALPGSPGVPGLALPCQGQRSTAKLLRTRGARLGATCAPSPAPTSPSSPPPRAPCAPPNPPRRLPPAPAWLRGRSSLGTSRSGAAAGSLPSKMAESLPEHDRILQEIESTDTACVGPTLRCGARGPPRR